MLLEIRIGQSGLPTSGSTFRHLPIQPGRRSLTPLIQSFGWTNYDAQSHTTHRSVREPTRIDLAPPSRALVGPVLYTVDATDLEQWRYFSYHIGSVIENPGAKDWDLAFRRYQIIANGGREFVGGAGIVDLGEVAFADVKTVPDAGYLATEGVTDPRNSAIANWYSYGLCLPLIRPIGLMPPAAGIRDAVHRRAAPSPLCPDSAAAQSEAWVRLLTAINVSASRCSSRRTSTGSLEDAVRRSRRRGPGIHVESSRSPARHTRFATASGAQ